jgi:arylsulfatase
MAGRQNWQAGREAQYNMQTFDDALVKASSDFMDKARKDGKPFFVWHNTTRMHVWSFIPPKYQEKMPPGATMGWKRRAWRSWTTALALC